ncbi:isoprenylcysteine carboxylmethyltransferase family protein [bacterium]|nr:isoprenylcysteine carboxylmethyltransferase family protein [bacterium]
MIANWTPAVFLGLFLALGFGWRSWLQWRRFGHTGLVLFRSGRWSQHLREAALFALPVLLGIEVTRAGLAPGEIARIEALAALGGIGFALGCVLAFGGLWLMVRAQLEMGASWRVGVDDTSRPGLVTHGLYRWTRNPIYLAMFLALAGLVLLLPTWLTLLTLVGAIVAVRSQVREEEAYLLRAYGDAYRAYTARVGRFLPRLVS